MNKKITLMPIVVLACASLAGCNKGSDGIYVVPTFDEGTKINLVAYSPSCPSALLPGGANPSTMTDEVYKNIAKAGFTHTLSLREGYVGADISLEATLKKSYKVVNEQNLQVLDYCQKYGLKHYARDWTLYNMGVYVGYDNPLSKFRSEVDSYEEYQKCIEILFPESTDPNERQYFKHPAYAGNYLTDEPFYSELKTIGQITKLYNERMEELGVENVRPILNLYPCHAGGSSLGPGWEDYVDNYYAYAGKKVNSISYDFYPFMKGKKNTSYLKDLFLYNLQIAAEKCKDYGCNLETYIQTHGNYTGMRDLTSIGDFRFQLYSNLAFGASTITYYEYGTPTGEDKEGFGLLDLSTGKLTKNYELAKQANYEVKAFEKEITCYRYDDIMCKNADPENKNLNFEMLNNNRGSVSANGRVAITSVTQDAFVTSLKRKTDNSDAFMLVNFTDPFNDLNNTVTLKFENTDAILVYKLGERKIIESSSGYYTFELLPGEGTFIVPLN